MLTNISSEHNKDTNKVAGSCKSNIHQHWGYGLNRGGSSMNEGLSGLGEEPGIGKRCEGCIQLRFHLLDLISCL